MGADQDFEAFLREWANERIWSSGDSLGTHALQQLRAELHAIELIQLAKERIASRMSMCAMSTMSSIEDVFINIAMARPKISLRDSVADTYTRRRSLRS